MKDLVIYFSKNEDKLKEACNYSIKKYGKDTLFLKFTSASAIDNFLSEGDLQYSKISLLDLDMVNSYEDDELRRLSNASCNKLACHGVMAITDDVFEKNKNALYVSDGAFIILNSEKNLKEICDGFYNFKEQINTKVKSATDLKKSNMSYIEPNYNKIYKQYSKEHYVHNKEDFIDYMKFAKKIDKETLNELQNILINCEHDKKEMSDFISAVDQACVLKNREVSHEYSR